MIKIFKINKNNEIKFAIPTTKNDSIRIIDKNLKEEILYNPYRFKLITCFFSWEKFLSDLNYKIIEIIYFKNKKELNIFLKNENNFSN